MCGTKVLLSVNESWQPFCGATTRQLSWDNLLMSQNAALVATIAVSREDTQFLKYMCRNKCV